MAIKVFISYAHESEILSNNVLELSNYLRIQGIDSEIDQYEESPPEGWPKWMMRQVQEADYVLIVCSKLFYERSNDFSQSDDGLGVKWETSLILQQLYTMSTNNKKFIPIIFEKSDSSFIPLPLQPYTYYSVSDLSTKEKLRKRLLGISISARPELGEIAEETKEEPFDPKERKSLFFTSVIDVDLWDKAKWKGIVFISDPSLKVPPIIGFLFTHGKYGDQIFSDLKERFTHKDEKDELRISIIEKINPVNTKHYKVTIGSDLDVIVEKFEEYGIKPQESLFSTVSRINEMTPDNNSKNVEIFKHSYNYFNKYYITNVNLEDGRPVPNFNNLIEKQKLNFRIKSDIVHNRHDPDIVAFPEYL